MKSFRVTYHVRGYFDFALVEASSASDAIARFNARAAGWRVSGISSVREVTS